MKQQEVSDIVSSVTSQIYELKLQISSARFQADSLHSQLTILKEEGWLPLHRQIDIFFDREFSVAIDACRIECYPKFALIWPSADFAWRFPYSVLYSPEHRAAYIAAFKAGV